MTEPNDADDKPTEAPRAATLRVDRADDAVRLTFGGDWVVKYSLPSIDEVRRRFTQSPSPGAVQFDATGLGRWDSGLVTRLIDIYRDARAHSIPFDDGGLPEGARRLIALAFAVKPREGAA